MRTGKFTSLYGYESVSPTANPFYSHGYLFNWVGPYTQTGIYGSYSFNDAWALSAGISRGWDQANEDNNGSINFLAQVKWTLSKQTSITFATIIGPESAGNSSDYRTLLDFVLTHAFNDKFSVNFEADYVWEPHLDADGGTASWYGVAGYASYILNDYFTLNGRVEWFRDDDGVRTGVAADYYEVTAGVTIKPFPHDKWGQYLLIRPELRGDFSDQRVFNDASDYSMFTFGIDMIYSF